MKSWKDNLENAINVNSMLFQYEQQLAFYKRMFQDLEVKNKKLHACSMTAHKMICDFLEMDRSLFTHDVEGFFNNIRAIKDKMEEILGDNEQTLATSGDSAGNILT